MDNNEVENRISYIPTNSLILFTMCVHVWCWEQVIIMGGIICNINISHMYFIIQDIFDAIKKKDVARVKRLINNTNVNSRNEV